MAIYTQLSPTATPGRRYSFSAKSGGGEHTGDFTELGVLGVPGPRHSFSAKDPAAGIGHSGEFTYLAVYGTPGGRHEFSAKTPSDIVITEPEKLGGPRDYGKARREQLIREDGEILMFIAAWTETIQ